MSIFNIQF